MIACNAPVDGRYQAYTNGFIFITKSYFMMKLMTKTITLENDVLCVW